MQRRIYDSFQTAKEDDSYSWVDSEVYEIHMGKVIDELPETATKKLKVISIHIVLGDSESTVNPITIADYIGCTRQYARSVEYDYETQTVIEEPQLDSLVRETILERDIRCQRCRSESNLEVHHIIPHADGGSHKLDNLITLCHSCHWSAHGDTWSDLNYSDKSEFKTWLRSS